MTYISIHFNLGYNLDLTLLSIAIIFPLVFNIRGAFRRREKALQHLSQYRSALVTISFYLHTSTDMTEEDKEKTQKILAKISDETVHHLKDNEENVQAVDAAIEEFHTHITELEEFIPRRIRDRIFRYMNDMQEGFENVFAINIHRTPMALKAYCLIFIYIFPLIYAPTIIYNIGATHSDVVVYFIVVVTEFILISLYNIQDHMEYPFDDIGVDDIKLENFQLHRKAYPTKS
ncbi:MAG: hypothetical protein R3252_00735 [Robiginitalea sp.]|nr:hypothetical protein [Robiginitalea sp.]